ncbi:ABC transporter ATP-binding protein [Cyclobacterium qasimii]|uniref:Putative multidrug export ATP-binding/permease protein YgaD n=1 Tax=Cyclobacterium qasimii TaxID=1350429 RepID=A0A512C7S5_9BACT|nr:ABC transporter ATP-binding protein [Cyclobacterium qasimii]GEO20251.1 putative multidrug export ATP-binding/permease protein YgaD [Cyclobacterium qasimii]
MTENKSKASLKSVFKTIIWPRRKYIFTGLFLIIISRLSGLVLPWASKYLVDDVIPSSDFELLKWLIVAVVISVTIQSVTSFGLTQILSVEAQNLIAKLRVEVQAHIIRLPIRFFDNAKTGELVSRVMTDVEGVRNLVGTGLAQMVGGILTSLISLVLLIYISPKMTLYVLVPVVIFGVISLKAFGRIRPIFRERGKINADVTGRLTETLGGIRVIKGFNAEDQETKIFESGVNRLFLNVKSSLTATSFVTSAATFLLGLASAGIMGIGGYMIMQDQLTFGDFLAFTLLLGFMIAPILQMSNIGSQLTEAFAGLDRTQELMNIPLEADPTTRNIVLPQIKGRVAFENVHFEYESGTEIIKGVDFVAEPGTVTALVGSSGSGKTTISGLVASFLNPSKGLVTVDGQDLSKVDLNSFRRQLGVVLQDDFLFEGTIRENIMFPRPDASEELLQEAVKSAYVHQFTDHFEKGLETVIGERGVKLSGGQRQRLAIARAILADPRILILDEATSNLDAESEHFIQSSLKSLMEGRTTFVIAHRLSTIRQADQILVIEKGKIVERGRHDELININGRYHDLYNFQARI